MNTIRELKQQEKYKNMLKRKNKEKNIYKDKNSTLRIEKMKDFEKFREEKSNIENKISKLIENLCKEYDIELDDIEFDTFRIYADQKTKSVSIKLKFDL